MSEPTPPPSSDDAAGAAPQPARRSAADRATRPADSADAQPWIPVRAREVALAAGLALAVLLPGLASFSLIDPWEGHYGEVARRMLEEDDWVKLQWQNEPYFRSKPGLTFWLMAASMELHGVATDGGYSGEMIASPLPVWALRLPFALFGAFGIVILWYAVARLVSRRAAWLTFGVLATTPFYTLVARQAITDMPMVATAAGAIACFLLAVHAGDRELKPLWKRITGYHVFLAVLGLFLGVQLVRFGIDFAADPSLGAGVRVRWFHPAVWATAPYAVGYGAFAVLTWVVFPTRRVRDVYMYWAYFLVGVSVLAKGPPGAAMVVIACGLYVVVTGNWRLLLRIALPQGVLVLALTAVPWHMAMVLKDGRPWVSEYFGHHWFKRAAVGVHGETGTFDYFAQQLGIGLWPWIALVPAALYAALRRPTPRDREGRVWMIMGLWAIGGFAFFSMVQTKFHHYVLPAVPAFAALAGLWIDEVLRGRSPRPGLAMVLGIPAIALIARDMMSEQKQLIELFVYRYDRPWPSGAPWNVDVGGVWLAFAALGCAALAVAAWPRTRRWGLAAFGLVCIAYGHWAANGYMQAAAPHWGQRHLHETYYRDRQIHGLDIVYYGLRDLADDWSGGGRELRVRSVLPDGFREGLPMTVHIEIAGQDEAYDLAGTVSRIGDNAFWIAVPDGEVAKLADAIARGRSLPKPKRRPWSQVNADRLIAWQLNWRGENFWSSGEIWGRTKDTQTVFVNTDNKEFLAYLNRPEAKGRRFYVITEAGRADGLRNILPTERARQTVEKIDTSCNKFTLLRFEL